MNGSSNQAHVKTMAFLVQLQVLVLLIIPLLSISYTASAFHPIHAALSVRVQPVQTQNTCRLKSNRISSCASSHTSRSSYNRHFNNYPSTGTFRNYKSNNLNNKRRVQFLYSTPSDTLESSNNDKQNDCTKQNNIENKIYYQSYVETVKCENFMLNASPSTSTSTSTSSKNNNEVVIHLGTDGPNLVAITGETGSGKSLLVFKVFQLVLGEKVSPAIMRGSTFASGEVGKLDL